MTPHDHIASIVMLTLCAPLILDIEMVWFNDSSQNDVVYGVCIQCVKYHMCYYGNPGVINSNLECIRTACVCLR